MKYVMNNERVYTCSTCKAICQPDESDIIPIEMRADAIFSVSFHEYIKCPNCGRAISIDKDTPIELCAAVIKKYVLDEKNMKVPKIDWRPFDRWNPPVLPINEQFLILLREDYDKWIYSVDVATPYGSYLDDFWNTENDWVEGDRRVEVVAYAYIPYWLEEVDLVEF